MNKRPLSQFAFAVYRWSSFRKEWDHYAYVASVPTEHLLTDTIKSLVSGRDLEYVAVENLHATSKQPTYEYWSGKNGNFAAFTPRSR